MPNNSIGVNVNCRIGSGFCGKCCYDTEMILTLSDIVLIASLGYSINYFAELRDNYVRLRNINNHCVFLDPKTNKCMIYPWRPLGCRLYPLVYDPRGDEVLVDNLCPRAKNLENKVKVDTTLYKHLFKKILEEAEEAVRFFKHKTLYNP